MNNYECPYCTKPLPVEPAPCCGEMGHAQEEDWDPMTLKNYPFLAGKFPKSRYARITIRNPNKRGVRLEVCGSELELGAGESADYCLTDESRSRATPAMIAAGMKELERQGFGLDSSSPPIFVSAIWDAMEAARGK